MKMQNITDFRETGAYKHIKLVKPSALTDEQLIVYALSQHLDNVFYTLQDAHVFSAQHGTSIKIPLAGDPFKPMYDGIYDIWLRDCNNVGSISVVFNDVEIPITEFKRQGDSIQIPLAFMGDLKHVFIHTESCFGWRKRISFIPSVALAYDNLCIKLNEGATCKVHISTVYFQNIYRRELVNSSNIFYVNGIPLITRCGSVAKHEEKTKSQNGCIIC